MNLKKLMSILAGYAWGRMDEKNPTLWKVAHNIFVKNAPAGQSGLISYKDYIEQMLPDKTEIEEPNQQAKQSFNLQQKEKRMEYYLNFAKPGGPGLKMKADLDKMLKHISLPRIVVEELRLGKESQQQQEGQNQNQEESEQKERHPLYENFKDGRYFILPYFFKTILSLKKAKKEFAIVFRSFGTDIGPVITEFNKFCLGEHPCYNGKNAFQLARFDGSKNTKNYVIGDSQKVCLTRRSPELEDITGVFGTLNRLPVDLKEGGFEQAYAKEVEEDIVKIEHEAQNVYLRIMELLKTSCALAVSDDYQAWQKGNFKNNFAKPLLIDQYDYSTLQIFFDDNIEGAPELEDDNIVDVRDVVLGQKLSNRRAINKYLVKVEPIQVLRDGDYFMKQIELCEKARLEEIDRLEKGISVEQEESVELIDKKTQWQALQELPDSDYLRRTILPLLFPALQLVDNERPNDPLSFIALYLLKNKDKVKIPQPDLPLDKQEQADKDAEGGQEGDDQGEINTNTNLNANANTILIHEGGGAEKKEGKETKDTSKIAQQQPEQLKQAAKGKGGEGVPAQKKAPEKKK